MCDICYVTAGSEFYFTLLQMVTVVPFFLQTVLQYISVNLISYSSLKLQFPIVVLQ